MLAAATAVMVAAALGAWARTRNPWAAVAVVLILMPVAVVAGLIP